MQVSGPGAAVRDDPPVPPSRVRRRRRRRALRSAGLVLALLGASVLGTVAWELWGTGIETARAQSRFREEVARRGLPLRPVPGGVAGFIVIPRLGLDAAFVEGISPKALARGPGHYPDTPMPGWTGNVAIAGHRTTHGAPFWSLEELRTGDLVFLETRRGRFAYRVQWSAVLPPEAWGPVGGSLVPSLTLTTCNPRFSDRERLVVRAVQVHGKVPGGFIGDPGRPPSDVWLSAREAA